MSSGPSSVVRGGAVVAASTFVAGLILILISIVIARFAGPTQFGIYSITVNLQNVVMIFSSLSIGSAVAKYVAENRVRDMKHALKFASTGLRLVLTLSTVTAVVYLALAHTIGHGLYHELGVVSLIPFSALVVFSAALLLLVEGVVQGNHQMGLFSLMQVVVRVITLLFVVTFLPLIGIEAAFLGLFLAQIAVAVLVLYWLGRTGFPTVTRSEVDPSIDHKRVLLSFAVPATLGSLIVLPLFWVGNIMLALDWGFLAAGHFAVGMVFFQARSVLPSSLAVPLIPTVSAMSADSRDRIQPLMSQSMRTVAVVFFPLFFTVALFSGEIVSFLYGPDYHDSGLAAYLMVTACYCASIAVIFGAAIAGLGRMWFGLGLNLLWGAMFLVLVIGLNPPYGPTGLAMAF